MENYLPYAIMPLFVVFRTRESPATGNVSRAQATNNGTNNRLGAFLTPISTVLTRKQLQAYVYIISVLICMTWHLE